MMNSGGNSRYFDNAATTRLDPRVLAEMLPFLEQDYGNPNSLHSLGRKTHEAVEVARERVASLIGADDPSQIFFTSGATEANNWLVQAFPVGICSPFEHSSLIHPAELAQWRIWDSELSSPDEHFEVASLMTVNNETGTIWDLRDQAVSADFLHTDATQAVGKIPINLEGFGFASMSAHKFYGPKGVGALYCRDQPPSPLLIGGEQEQGYRSGTLNVPAIVGFGVAAQIAAEERERNFAHVTDLRSLLIEELADISDWNVLGGQKTSPFILCLSFQGVEGETVVIETDRAGFAISSGAACSSASTDPSHVLLAMNVPESEIRGTVRVSFGKDNSLESTKRLGQCLVQSVEKLRTLSKGNASLRNAN